jgi:peroxiredoxin
MLRRSVQKSPTKAQLGASLLAVSPQAPDASQTLVQRLGLGCHVLSDLHQSVSRAYQLQFELPPELRAANRQMGMALDEHNADVPNCRERMSVDAVLSALVDCR